MTQNTNISSFFLLFFNLIKNLLFVYLMFFPFLYFLRFFCICVINFEPFDYFWVTYERRVDHRMKDIFQYKWSLKQKLKKLEPDMNLLRVQTGACIQGLLYLLWTQFSEQKLRIFSKVKFFNNNWK